MWWLLFIKLPKFQQSLAAKSSNACRINESIPSPIPLMEQIYQKSVPKKITKQMEQKPRLRWREREFLREHTDLMRKKLGARPLAMIFDGSSTTSVMEVREKVECSWCVSCSSSMAGKQWRDFFSVVGHKKRETAGCLSVYCGLDPMWYYGPVPKPAWVWSFYFIFILF